MLVASTVDQRPGQTVGSGSAKRWTNVGPASRRIVASRSWLEPAAVAEGPVRRRASSLRILKATGERRQLVVITWGPSGAGLGRGSRSGHQRGPPPVCGRISAGQVCWVGGWSGRGRNGLVNELSLLATFGPAWRWTGSAEESPTRPPARPVAARRTHRPVASGQQRAAAGSGAAAGGGARSHRDRRPWRRARFVVAAAGGRRRVEGEAALVWTRCSPAKAFHGLR